MKAYNYLLSERNEMNFIAHTVVMCNAMSRETTVDETTDGAADDAQDGASRAGAT
jgi:hypothetical protein